MEQEVNEISIANKIDAVLSIFKPSDYILEYGETRKLIKEKLIGNANIGDRLLDEVLEKLEKDQYIRSVADGHVIRKEIIYIADPKIYLLTIEGELFIYNGGYSEQFKRSINPLRKLKTGLINAAALVAGLYYFFEIVRIYIVPVWQHACACNFVWQSTLPK
jgi:hypothetical protein